MTLPKVDTLSDAAKLRVLWVLALALAGLAAGLIWSLVQLRPPGIDFLPLWTAGRMAWTEPQHVYDFAAVTKAQEWLLPHLKWMRPYAYPPTALLFLAPFGALPFWPALTLWVGASFAAFAAAGARLAQRRTGLALLLMLCSPAVALAAVTGQTVVLATALATFAILELERRPRLAGVLLAFAAALKPQAALLAPAALLACGGFEALVSAALAGMLLVAASVACFGLARWPEWLASLPAFQAVVESTPRLMQGVITPFGAAFELGLTGLPEALWRAGFALLGLVLAWRAFACSRDPAVRAAALGAGSLLATPYAMNYDGTLLAPAAVVLALRLDAPGWPRRAVALCAVCEATRPHLGFVAVVAFGALTALELPAAALRARSASAVA
jgi:hypothetical protein